MALIDELVGILRLDYEGEGEAKKFSKDLDRAGKSLEGYANRIGRIGKAIAVGLAGALGSAGITRMVQGINQMVNTSTAELDKLAKTAEKVGFSTKALQETRFAASQMAGLETGTTDMALQRFSRRMAEAASGSGEALKIVKQFGVQLKNTDGSLRSSEAILGDFADIIANTSDQKERLRIAFKLFDSEGAAMVNALAKGRAGLEEYRKEANALGIVMSDDMIAAAAKFQETQDRLSKSFNAVRHRLSYELLPVFDRYATAALDWVRDMNTSGKLSRVLDGIGDAFATIASVTRQIALMGWDVGRGFFYAADGVAQMLSKVTGLDKKLATLTALGGGAAALGGKKLLLALARRVPWIAALLLGEDLLSALRGDDSVIGSTPEGQAAIERIGKAAKDATEAFDRLFEGAKAFRVEWKEALGETAILEGFTDPVSAAVKAMTAELNNIAAALELTAKVFGEIKAFTDDPGGWAGNQVKELVKSVGDELSDPFKVERRTPADVRESATDIPDWVPEQIREWATKKAEDRAKDMLGSQYHPMGPPPQTDGLKDQSAPGEWMPGRPNAPDVDPYLPVPRARDEPSEKSPVVESRQPIIPNAPDVTVNVAPPQTGIDRAVDRVGEPKPQKVELPNVKAALDRVSQVFDGISAKMKAAAADNSKPAFPGQDAPPIDWSKLVENFEGNATKMQPEAAAERVIADNRVANDNRDMSISAPVTVNQTVQQATSAPSAVARATGNAAASAVTKQRARIASTPSVSGNGPQ